jgi:aldehyde dehydrogenase (NAD+)
MTLIEQFNILSENRWNFSKTTVNERKAKLQRLKSVILNHREDIIDALDLDFKKPSKETELTEIFPIIEEINFAIKNLKKWVGPQGVSTPMVLFGTKSRIHYEAKGVSLIMAPWNYPFQLVMSPLVSAISAGCVVMVRPSEKAPHTSAIINKIIGDTFSKNEVCVALGGIEVSKEILDLAFDHIFFTGSIRVGKIVMEKAAKHLGTVTLELGGKSPVIIDSECDLEDAAEKIVWGKYINAGQTCVAPDYIFVPAHLKEKFLKLVAKKIKVNLGETSNDRKLSKDFARIIDEVSFNRLVGFLDGEKSLFEDQPSKEDHLFIPPTVLTDVNFQSKIMSEEIFGPIMPILTYEKIEEVISHIRSQGKPLALYIFSSNKKFVKNIISETSSGGVSVNHVIVHLANPYLPFGGVGTSGSGASHGFFGFKAFSHERAVLTQRGFSLLSFYFPPYSTWISKISFKFLRFLE